MMMIASSPGCGDDGSSTDAAPSLDAGAQDGSLDGAIPGADAGLDAGTPTDAGALGVDAPAADAGTDAAAAVGPPWVRRLGGGDDDVGRAIASDASGNVFVAGGFRGSVDFGGGALVSAGSDDIFVTSFARDGSFRWAARFGGPGADVPTDVAVDPSGNVLVAASMSDTIDFGGTSLVSAGGRDALVMALGPDGAPRWARRYGGAGSDDANGIAADGAGRVVVTGWFEASVDFGGGALTSAGSHDVFVIGLDGDGGFRWASRFGNASNDTSNAIAADVGGDVLVTGQLQGSVTFGGAPLTSTAGSADVVVVRLGADGSFGWARRFGGVGYDEGVSVAVGAAGQIAVTGRFEGTVDFGGGPVSSGSAMPSVFVVRLGADGSFGWARGYGDPTHPLYAADVAVAPSGRTLVTGTLQGPVDFGGVSLSASALGNVFVLALDPGGSTAWGRAYGSSWADGAQGIAATPSDDVLCTGSFERRLEFGGTSAASAGGRDAFVLDLDPEAGTPVTLP